MKKLSGLLAAGMIIAGLSSTVYATEPIQDTTAATEAATTQATQPATTPAATQPATQAATKPAADNSASHNTQATTPAATTTSAESNTGNTQSAGSVEDEALKLLEEEKKAKEEELKSLEKELSEVITKIGELDRRASELNAQIYVATHELENKTALRNEQYDEMKLRIKFMYENKIGDVDAAFSDDSGMDDVLNAAGYYQDIYSYDREKLEELDKNVHEIGELKTTLDAALQETEKNKAEMEEEKKKIGELVKEKEEDLKLINEGISSNVMRLFNTGSASGISSAATETLLKIAEKAQEEALKEGKANAKQVAVAQNAGHGRSTYPATYGWCAAWVSGVYSYTGGITPPHGDAIDYWNKWKASGSTRMDNIPIGACVISSGDPTYGHIGIYLGGGVVASNLGYCKVETIQSFGNVSAVCQGHVGYIGWVWPNGTPIE